MKYLFGVLLITVAAFGAAFGQCSDSDKKALEAFDTAWGVASVSGDRAALMNIYADDYMGMPSHSIIDRTLSPAKMRIRSSSSERTNLDEPGSP